MPTRDKIKATYEQLHNDLSEIYYDGTMGLTLDEFDSLHGQTWMNMEAELIANGHLDPPAPPPPDYRALLKVPGITDSERIKILMKAAGLD